MNLIEILMLTLSGIILFSLLMFGSLYLIHKKIDKDNPK
jgi:ABC-type antimicrobial peptide transport system permease subunit